MATRDFNIGDRIRLSAFGLKHLLPIWKVKTTTAIVIAIVTSSGDIIRVRRSGVQAEFTGNIAYWDRDEYHIYKGEINQWETNK